jgi:hypothetical protein
MFDFLKNAFGSPEHDVVSPDEIPLERKKILLEGLAKGIVERRLTAPAIFFLESVKPLNFIGSQAMIFFEPIIRSVFPFKTYSEFAILLQDRETLELLIQEVERLDSEKSSSKK